MTNLQSIGFPCMKYEDGEARVFLPKFIQSFAKRGIAVHLEAGYGEKIGYNFEDYRNEFDNIFECSREQSFSQDIVIILRSPDLKEFEMLRPGSCLISMLHYPTRPKRVKKLMESGIKAISLDGIVDDRNLRLVENMSAVAWNGLEVAYGILEKKWPYLCRPDGNPFRVLILGTGMVGKHAVDAATKLGNHKRNSEHMQRYGPGSLGISVDQNITYHDRIMQELFHDTDILVDATKRQDTSKPVIPNHWIAWLPDHAVMVDLAVDPYTMDTNPPVVRGLEGIPQGNLDKYIFTPDDPDWDKSVPDAISSDQRRTVVSCYSWPGIHPVSCMQHYQQQMAPLMEILLRKGYDNLSLQGEYFERALSRATLRHWIEDDLPKDD